MFILMVCEYHAQNPSIVVTVHIVTHFFKSILSAYRWCRVVCTLEGIIDGMEIGLWRHVHNLHLRNTDGTSFVALAPAALITSMEAG